MVGHRSMGMVFDLAVTGSTASASASPTATGMAGMGHSDIPLTRTVDATAPATPADHLHQVTLHVREVPLEVAPGVWQTRWTYNGGPVGPTLRGAVGDVFEVTLINDGSMGPFDRLPRGRTSAGSADADDPARRHAGLSLHRDARRRLALPLLDPPP